MLIYTDIFNGDEMLSDSFDVKEIVDGCILCATGKSMVVGGDTFDIGANPAEGEENEVVDDSQETVINIVHVFKLTETFFDKKGYMGYIKSYMKKVKAYLEENAPDRVDAFMKGVQPFVKTVLGEFKEYQFFMGESMDPECNIVLLRYSEDGMTPMFYYFKDGLKEIKC